VRHPHKVGWSRYDRSWRSWFSIPVPDLSMSVLRASHRLIECRITAAGSLAISGKVDEFAWPVLIGSKPPKKPCSVPSGRKERRKRRALQVVYRRLNHEKINGLSDTTDRP